MWFYWIKKFHTARIKFADPDSTGIFRFERLYTSHNMSYGPYDMDLMIWNMFNGFRDKVRDLESKNTTMIPLHVYCL